MAPLPQNVPLANVYASAGTWSATAKKSVLDELAKLRLHIDNTHLHSEAFQRLLNNRSVELPRLVGLLAVIVREALREAGIDADAAMLVKEGEPGYGWTNGGWLLGQLQPQLQQQYDSARAQDHAFARALHRASAARSRQG